MRILRILIECADMNASVASATCGLRQFVQFGSPTSDFIPFIPSSHRTRTRYHYSRYIKQPHTPPTMDDRAWPSREDIKETLSARYGAESDFPTWTTPFIHAVGVFEELESAVKWRARDRCMMLDHPTADPFAVEKRIERLAKEVVSDLSSVSIGNNLSGLPADTCAP